jgi:CHASE3 domain sensor protein
MLPRAYWIKPDFCKVCAQSDTDVLRTPSNLYGAMRPLPTSQNSLAPLNRGLTVTTTLTALVVAAVAFIGLQNRGHEAWVRHSLAVRSNLLGVAAAVRDAESAQRGYLLTGRSLYRVNFIGKPFTLDQLAAKVRAVRDE